MSARGRIRQRCATIGGLAVLFLVLLIGARSRPARAEGAAPADPPRAVDPVGDDDAEAPQVWDPIEPTNRRTLRMNAVIDRWFFSPLTRAYTFAVPNPARKAVRRFLFNLESPAILANDVLQLAPVDATVTLTRFVVNTTVGVAGLFDPADRMGLERHHTDFGQTLALYGVPSGPYVVLPVLGPTTARDGSGYVVDFLFQPTTYVLPGLTLFIYAAIHQGSIGLSALDAYGDQLHALEASSVDFYAALRSAYYQDRMAAIAARSDRGPRGVARRLGMLSLRPSGGEVVDLAAQDRGERLEALALQH